MIVDDGFEKENQLLNSNINTAKVGTDDTAPSASDSDLGSSVATMSTTDGTVSKNTYTVKATLGSTQGNGNTLNEVGLFFSGGTIYTRETHPDLEKTSADEVIYFYKIVRERA